MITLSQELGGESVVMELHDGIAVPELLDAVKRFMLACGYIVEGDLEFVTEEIPVVKSFDEDDSLSREVLVDE
jgi:hypothetical protein